MNSPIQQAQRVITGHCPECGTPTVVLNNHEVWPYIRCECGKNFDTTSLVNAHRIEQGFIINNDNRVILARPR